MSYINVEFKNGLLVIEKKTSRKNENNIEKIPFEFLEYGKLCISKIKPTNKKEKNKILFLKEIDNIEEYEKEDTDDDKKYKAVIAVYSDDETIQYIYCSIGSLYKRIVNLKFKVLTLGLTKKRLKIRLVAYLINKYKLDIQDTKFYIDEKLYKKDNLKQYNKQISLLKRLEKENIHTFNFKIKDILEDESIINGAIKYVVKINGTDINYRIGIKGKVQNTQHYYSPIKSIFIKDFAVHIRRTIKGNLTLVKRKKEPIENTLKFKLIVINLISAPIIFLNSFLSFLESFVISVAGIKIFIPLKSTIAQVISLSFIFSTSIAIIFPFKILPFSLDELMFCHIIFSCNSSVIIISPSYYLKFGFIG